MSVVSLLDPFEAKVVTLTFSVTLRLFAFLFLLSLPILEL